VRGKKSDSFVKLQMKRVALVERIPVGECGRRYRDKAAAVVASIILVCKVPQLFLLRAIAERGHHGTPLCEFASNENNRENIKTGNLICIPDGRTGLRFLVSCRSLQYRQPADSSSLCNSNKSTVAQQLHTKLRFHRSAAHIEDWWQLHHPAARWGNILYLWSYERLPNDAPQSASTES
jgi:hypothetical protein